MRVDVKRRSSKCVDVSAPNIYGRWYEAQITKNSSGCFFYQQTLRVLNEDVHLLVDRRLLSSYRRLMLSGKKIYLHLPAGIVFVFPPSSVVGACITVNLSVVVVVAAPSVVALDLFLVVVANPSVLGQQTYISDFVVVRVDVGVSDRQAKRL